MSKPDCNPSLSPRAVEGLKYLQDNWMDFYDCIYHVEGYIWDVKRSKEAMTDSQTLNALDKLKEIVDLIKPLEL